MRKGFPSLSRNAPAQQPISAGLLLQGGMGSFALQCTLHVAHANLKGTKSKSICDHVSNQVNTFRPFCRDLDLVVGFRSTHPMQCLCRHGGDQRLQTKFVSLRLSV